MACCVVLCRIDFQKAHARLLFAPLSGPAETVVTAPTPRDRYVKIGVLVRSKNCHGCVSHPYWC